MALSMPNFLTCSLWAVNTVISEDRLLLWRSRTRPTRATSGMGASTHRVDPRRDGPNGPTPDLRHGAARSEVYPFSVILRDRRDWHNLNWYLSSEPQWNRRREDRLQPSLHHRDWCLL